MKRDGRHAFRGTTLIDLASPLLKTLHPHASFPLRLRFTAVNAAPLRLSPFSFAGTKNLLRVSWVLIGACPYRSALCRITAAAALAGCSGMSSAVPDVASQQPATL